MVDLTADLFLSLDGFAAGVDVEGYFGYFGPDLEKRLHDVMSTPHVVVMGRVTYEAMAAISSPATDPASSWMNEIPKVVVSNTLKEPLAWNNTRLVSGELSTQIQALKQQSDVPLRTIGSLTLVKGLLEAGLVDRIRITVFPIVLGNAGREPFSVGHTRTGLDLVDTKVLDSRLVMLEYQPSTAPKDHP
ncbi:dihydrofolate reductase family protein [Actinopolymorpha alba]|uniref:dihydrofolate reductase family protein n=1 Tax=Actinopolymorpha alba TaxID=533267 RepID=UPI000377A14C|nr:dihydrofolate reductase family protein [Actinopolymorpha alba]